jgi:6-pyruvoyl-tetrahydropterin synthase related domain
MLRRSDLRQSPALNLRPQEPHAHLPTPHLPALFPCPTLTIMAASFAVILPFFFLGNPSGHDFEFHLFSWMEVLGQWKHGIFYPRWAALAHWGYGEARFIFYPPASWTLGAALGALLPWKMASGAYIWIALTASGVSMFVLARRWFPTKDAIFAAALYAANPYYIVIVYWRSAFAELLSGALLPLLLYLVLRMHEDGRKIIIPLLLVVATAWLINAPSAVMLNYSLALLIALSALLWRSPRVLAYGGIAIVLGAALAAFYIIPAAYEEKWVNLAEALAPGVRPQDNFLFTTIADPDHNRFNLLVSTIAVAEMIVLAGTLWLARRWRAQWREAWWLLVLWMLAALLLMFSFTSIFWQHLPKLRFVQLPWRWLLSLNVAFALLLTMGTRRWLSRIALCVAMLGVIFAAGHKFQPPWWDTAADIEEMHDAVEGGAGYEGTDEYVPAGGDPYELSRDAPKVTIEGDKRGQVHILGWRAEIKSFTVETPEDTNLVLRLFDYPAWQAEVDGKMIAAGRRELTGQMMIPVQAGSRRVNITFVRTWDRTLGASLSSAAAVVVVVMFLLRRKEYQLRE